MYSKELMKFLINYQIPEFDKDVHKKAINFKYNPKNGKTAAVLLLNKK